jgi:WD40 repeat protein
MDQKRKFAYDLFVVYAKEDGWWVRGYFLERLGLPQDRVMTSRDLRPGHSIADEFEDAVTSSRHTVLVLTPAFEADVWTSFGGQLAGYASVEEQSNRLIPVALGMPIDKLPLRVKWLVSLDCTQEKDWDTELARLLRLLEQPERQAKPRPTCPYPGIHRFDIDDAPFFKGREAEIQDLALRLRVRRQHRVLVIGASGCGKSSLVYGGLVPRLQSPEPPDWLVRDMRPGDTPLAELARCLEVAPEALADANVDFRGAVDAVLSRVPPARQLLIIVDQLEELFTLARATDRIGESARPQPSATTSAVIAVLNSLSALENCFLVLTMRADFIDHLKRTDLWPRDAGDRDRTLVEIFPLRGEALREAIAAPAAQQGVYFQPELLLKLVEDAHDEPGALPLLQVTLQLLWEKMVGHLIPLQAYLDLVPDGQIGIAAALEQLANGALDDLTARGSSHEAVAKRIFLRLIEFGNGRDDLPRGQSIARLRSQQEEPQQFDQTLGILTERRLLTVDCDRDREDGTTAREPTLARNPDEGTRVDIAHEVLLTAWPTLHTWVKEYRPYEQLRRRLSEKVETWQRGERPLLDWRELKEARTWLKNPYAAELGQDSSLQEFVNRSVRARLQHLVLTAVAAVCIVAGTWSLYLRDEQARVESARGLARTAIGLRDRIGDSVTPSVLLTLEAMHVAPAPGRGPDPNLHPELDQALRDGVSLLRPRIAHWKYDERLKTVAFSRDGLSLLTVATNGARRRWEWRTGKPLSEIPDSANSASGSDPELRYLATPGGALEGIRVRDVRTGREFDLPALQPQGVLFTDLAVGGDANLLAAAGTDATVRVWQLSRSTVAAGGRRASARAWLVARLAHDRPTSNSAARAVAFTRDGRFLATFGDDQVLSVWDMGVGPDGGRLVHGGAVTAVAVSPKRTFVATGGDNQTVCVWETSTGRLRMRLPHRQAGPVFAFSPDEQYLTSTTRDRAVEIHAIPSQPVSIAPGALYSISRPMRPEEEITALAFSPTGEHIAVGGSDGVVKTVSLPLERRRSATQLLQPLPYTIQHDNAVSGIAFSSGARYLLTVGDEGKAQLSDPKTGVVRQSVKHEEQGVAAFSLVGERLLRTVRADGTVSSLDLNSRELSLPSLVGGRRTNHLNPASFSEDGKFLAIMGDQDSLRVWDTTRWGQPLAVIEGFGQIEDPVMALSARGSYLALGGSDGTVQLRRAADGRLLARLKHGDGVMALAFSADEALLVATGRDGCVRIWHCDTGALMREACRRLTRDLTPGEWRSYVGPLPSRLTRRNLCGP